MAGSQGFEPCTCRLTADRTRLMCFLPKFGGLYWIPTSHRSIGILPDSDYRLLRTQGTPIEPLSLQVLKLVVNAGIEPTGPEGTDLQSAEANHIAHIHQRWSARKDLNLRPHGSKPSTLPDCATDRDYRLRCPVSALGTFVTLTDRLCTHFPT